MYPCPVGRSYRAALRRTRRDVHRAACKGFAYDSQRDNMKDLMSSEGSPMTSAKSFVMVGLQSKPGERRLALSHHRNEQAPYFTLPPPATKMRRSAPPSLRIPETRLRKLMNWLSTTRRARLPRSSAVKSASPPATYSPSRKTCTPLTPEGRISGLSNEKTVTSPLAPDAGGEEDLKEALNDSQEPPKCSSRTRSRESEPFL